MCEGPLLKKIVVYTIPIILTGILQLLFNAADLVVVGQYCGNVSVAAVGATGALINLIVNLFIGLSVGAGVSVAQFLGAKKSDAVRRVVHTSIPAAFLSGAFLTVVGVAGARWFLELMDTPDNVLPLSATYMRIYFCGMISSMIYNFGAAILRAAGDTKSPLIYLTVAGVVNVFLNLFFVIVLKMDVAGVALATIISQTISAILTVMALMKRTDACRFELKAMAFHKDALVKIIKIGVPAGIQGSLFSISNVLIQSSINSFGDLVMSGNAAAGNIEGFVYITMNAFHQTTLNFVGQNLGAGKMDRVHKVVGIDLLLVTLMGLVTGLAAFHFGRSLLSIYRMSFVCAPYFLCGLMDVMNGALRGLGSSMEPLIITVLGVCVMRVVWIYTVFRIPAYHTLSCLYVSYPISWILTLLAQIVGYLLVTRRLKRRLTPAVA